MVALAVEGIDLFNIARPLFRGGCLFPSHHKRKTRTP